MAATCKDQLTLVLPMYKIESNDTGIAVPCNLSPEISAVDMEIRWFKETDCVCLYKNRQVTEGRGYMDRVSLFTQELEKGNVSLQLKHCRESDAGTYLCQVTNGYRNAEITLKLYWDSTSSKSQHRKGFVRQWNLTWTDEEKRQMEKSAKLTAQQIFEVPSEIRDWETNIATELGDLTMEGVLAQDRQKSISLLSDQTVGCKSSLSNIGEIPESSLLFIRKQSKSEFSLPKTSFRPAAQVLQSHRLVLLGRTGPEKSAAVNTILGREEGSQAATSTVTQHSKSRQGKVAGRQVTVVDTPDWFCPELSLEEVREDVGLCVRLSAPGPHAFLLGIPISKYTGDERGMLEKMEDILGEKCLRFTMVLFLSDESQEKGSEHFFESQEFQRLVDKCGSRFHCLSFKENANRCQVVRLLEKIEEMVEGTDGFYNSQLYLAAERQAREIKNEFIKDREKMKEKRERKAKDKLEKSLEELFMKFTESAGEYHVQISQHKEQINKLERKIIEEKDDKIREGVEKELEREIEQKEVVQMDLKRLEEDCGKRRSELEERHRLKMEEICEEFEEDIRVERERNLIKIILSEHQGSIYNFNAKK